MARLDVYLPLMVRVEDGSITEAYIDWEGTPWSITDNVWSLDDETWGTDGDAEEVASGFVTGLIQLVAALRGRRGRGAAGWWEDIIGQALHDAVAEAAAVVAALTEKDTT